MDRENLLKLLHRVGSFNPVQTMEMADILLGMEAAHVRDYHGPANAVEQDTAADVKEEGETYYQRHDGRVIYEYPRGWIYAADGSQCATDSGEGSISCGGYARIPAAEACALIAKWQAEKQPAPSPAPAPAPTQAPERVMVTHHPKDGALGTALALGDPYALRPSIRWEAVEYVRLDIAEGLNGKLALANARLAELERNIGYYRQIIADAAVRMQSEADALRKR